MNTSQVFVVTMMVALLAAWTAAGEVQHHRPCKRQCFHGGHPNQECNYCIGCLGAWQGSFCETYNSTAAGVYPVLFDELVGAAHVKVAHLATAESYPPVPGWRSLGFTFNLGTMQQTVVPGLLLNFSDPHHVFVSGGKVYQVPDQMTITEYDPTGDRPPTQTCTTFETMDAVFDAQSAITNDLAATIGLLATMDPTTLQNYFNSKQFITYCTAVLPIYGANSPAPASALTSTFLTQSTASLPTSYTSGASVIDQFIDEFGTHYVNNVTMGGMAEVIFSHPPCLSLSMGTSTIETYAAQALDNMVAGFNWTTGLEDSFVNAARIESTNYYGGDPESASIKAWLATVRPAPTPLHYSLTQLYPLATNFTTQVALQIGVQAYVQATYNKLDSSRAAAKKAADASWLATQRVTAYTGRADVVNVAAAAYGISPNPGYISYQGKADGVGIGNHNCVYWNAWDMKDVSPALCLRDTVGNLYSGFAFWAQMSGVQYPLVCQLPFGDDDGHGGDDCHGSDWRDICKSGPYSWHSPGSNSWTYTNKGPKSSPVVQGGACTKVAGGPWEAVQVHVGQSVSFTWTVQCCIGGATPDGSCTWAAA